MANKNMYPNIADEEFDELNNYFEYLKTELFTPGTTTGNLTVIFVCFYAVIGIIGHVLTIVVVKLEPSFQSIFYKLLALGAVFEILALIGKVLHILANQLYFCPGEVRNFVQNDVWITMWQDCPSVVAAGVQGYWKLFVSPLLALSGWAVVFISIDRFCAVFLAIRYSLVHENQKKILLGAFIFQVLVFIIPVWPEFLVNTIEDQGPKTTFIVTNNSTLYEDYISNVSGFYRPIENWLQVGLLFIFSAAVLFKVKVMAKLRGSTGESDRDKRDRSLINLMLITMATKGSQLAFNGIQWMYINLYRDSLEQSVPPNAHIVGIAEVRAYYHAFNVSNILIVVNYYVCVAYAVNFYLMLTIRSFSDAFKRQIVAPISKKFK